MGIWFWFLMAFIAFGFITIVRKWHDYAILFTIAIGFAINANIFNSFSTPISWGSFIFSIDSILYTGFTFTVIICAKEYGIRKAKILASSTIAAILLSAVIEFLAKISSFGYSVETLNTLFGYIFSALGTFAAIWIMLPIFRKLEESNVNININFVICVLIASIINTSIFYGFTMLTNGVADNLMAILVGSYIGKIFCILLGQTSYYINTHIFIPNSLKDKYKPIWQKMEKGLDEEKKQTTKNIEK